MDDQEMEEILYRLDERTKRVDEHLDRLDRQVRENRQTNQDHEERITDNEHTLGTMSRGLKGLAGAVMALFSGAGATFMGFINL